MAKQKTTQKSPLDTLRDLALKYPETAEGIACKGTPIEQPTVEVRG